MTHDELLAELDELDHSCSVVGITVSALRAVVELHKPVQSYMFEEKTCSHCSSEEDRSEILYPCPTIQAIEKELK
jgi:hypothetical protein